MTGHPYRLQSLCLLALVAMPGTASALQFHTPHSDPIAPVLLGVTGILFMALLGRFGARKLQLPSVLGELGMGILIGNLAYLFSFDLIIVLREGPALFDTIGNLLQGKALSWPAARRPWLRKRRHMYCHYYEDLTAVN